VNGEGGRAGNGPDCECDGCLLLGCVCCSGAAPQLEQLCLFGREYLSKLSETQALSGMSRMGLLESNLKSRECESWKNDVRPKKVENL